MFIIIIMCALYASFEWWGTGMVICLERDADLHVAQLMPLPLIVSCFSKIQIGFTFLVPAHPGSPRKKAFKRVCVCVSVCVSLAGHYHNITSFNVSYCLNHNFNISLFVFVVKHIVNFFISNINRLCMEVNWKCVIMAYIMYLFYITISICILGLVR